MKAEITLEVGKVYIVDITDPDAPAALCKKMVIIMDYETAININYLRSRNKCTVSVPSELEIEYVMYVHETLGKYIVEYDGIESYIEYKKEGEKYINSNYLNN